MSDQTAAETDLIYDSTNDTHKHRNEVIKNLRAIADNLNHRAIAHDFTKFTDPVEKRGYDLLGMRQRGLTYGSPEYFAQFDQVPEMLTTIQRHYMASRHHPEHFIDGVDQMTFDEIKAETEKGGAVSRMSLLDLIEMVADWAAATKRHDDGNLAASLEYNAKRFGISPQLARIIENTVVELGW